MASALPTPCKRCSHPLLSDFRFCPECALPVMGEEVLSTQIQEFRTRTGEPRPRRWPGFVVPAFWAGMGTFVVAVGWALFRPNAYDVALPQQPATTFVEGPTTDSVAEGADNESLEPEWVRIPGDRAYWVGDPDEEPDCSAIPEFEIAKFETSNREWRRFLVEAEEWLRSKEKWREAYPGEKGGWLLDEATGQPWPAEGTERLPVRNISAGAAMLYCNWLTRKLDVPGVRIRLPHQVEWEYAARITDERTPQRFPWPGRFWLSATPGTGGTSRIARLGINNEPLPVDALRDDRTYLGVMGMGTNVAEWVHEAVPFELRKDRAPGATAGDAETPATRVQIYEWVLPSLAQDAIPPKVQIRGASFQDKYYTPAHEPTETELEALREEQSRLSEAIARPIPKEARMDQLRGVPLEAPPFPAEGAPDLQKHLERSDMALADAAKHRKRGQELWDQHDWEAAAIELTRSERALFRVMQDGVFGTDRAAHELQYDELYWGSYWEVRDEHAVVFWRLEVDLAGLFLERGRTREAQFDWNGADEDYRRFIRLGSELLEDRPKDRDLRFPLAKDYLLSQLADATTRARRMRANRDTELKATAWDDNRGGIDSSLQSPTTGFRPVKVRYTHRQD